MKTATPNLDVKKIGIVARDYREEFANGYRDFSQELAKVLELLDHEGCDTVLFSLFSIIPRPDYNPSAVFGNLKNINVIFLEEFKDGENREAGRYVVYYRTLSGWNEYVFHQIFSTLTNLPQAKINTFVNTEMPKRILGNCCVLLCGESNGVKYSKADKKIHDTYGIRDSIPTGVNIILNPIHDRMTRFEMKLKRQFLSEHNRTVISVWNKGKQDINGNVKDGSNPPWTVFQNGKEKEVDRLPNKMGLEISVFNSKKP